MRGRSFRWSRDARLTAFGCPGSPKKILYSIVGLVLDAMSISCDLGNDYETQRSPLLSHHGVKSWPPTWSSLEEGEKQTLKGEIGILREVRMSRMMGGFNKCFLVINYEGSAYIGHSVRGQFGVLCSGGPADARSLWRIAN